MFFEYLYLLLKFLGIFFFDKFLKKIFVILYKFIELVFNDVFVYGLRIVRINICFVFEFSFMDVRLKFVLINYEELMLKLFVYL